MSRRLLPSGLPRGLANHRSEDGRVYRDNGRGVTARLQLDPRDPAIAPLLQRYCLMAVEHHRLTREIERRQAQPGKESDVFRLMRLRRKALALLEHQERYILEVARPKRPPTSISDLLEARARSAR